MADRPALVLVGAGGHARVLVDALRSAGYAETIVALDNDPARHGTDVLDVAIVGDDGMLETLVKSGTRYFAVAVGGTRDNEPRAELYARAASFGLEALTIVHPAAIVSPWASLGGGCQLLAGSIVNAGARLGANVIVNTAAVVEHDCTIGDHVHIATGARLASTVSVGSFAHVGIGAVVRQSVAVGVRAVVGAGAVVIRDVRPDALVVGVPARERLR